MSPNLSTRSILQIDIVQGPSKFDIMMSCFTWKPVHPAVDFMDPRGTYYSVLITAVEAKDGSGERWLFKGREVIGGKVIPTPLEGFIDTRTRTGYLKIVAGEIADDIGRVLERVPQISRPCPDRTGG